MIRKRFQLAIWGAVLAAGGCVEAPPQVAPPALPAVAVNGSYMATIALTDMAPGFQKQWCDTKPTAPITVVDNAFRYAMAHPGMPGNPTPVYEVQIKEDGTFRVENEAGVMLGSSDGTAIKAKINGTVCYYDFSAQRL